LQVGGKIENMDMHIFSLDNLVIELVNIIKTMEKNTLEKE